jgi:parvulin-like peptidyl-prolyl isomerase
MQSVFRSTLRMLLVFAAALVMTACAMRPSAVQSVPSPPAAAERDEKKIIVATVNGANITLHSLNQMINLMVEENPEFSSSEPREEPRKKALDRLIFQELAYQEAMRRGLRVDAAGVDSTMDRFITSVGRETGYKDFLEKQHLTPEELRSQIERTLALRIITSREVMEKISVTEEEVRKEYEQQKDLYTTPEKVEVIDVVFFMNQNDPASIKKAEEILAAINAGKDKSPWDLPPDNTFVVRDRLIEQDKEPVLYDAARKLKEEELSGVLKTADSIHIIKLTTYTPERQMPYEEVRDSIMGKRRTAARMKRLEAWKRELRKGTKIVLMDIPKQPDPKKP